MPLLVAFLILSAMIADAGHAHGSGTGWFLCFLLCAGAWAWDYGRRLGRARTALRLKLHAQSCLEAVDAMTGHQFEFYYARLPECLGWTRIQVIGEKSGGDGGADILATDPRQPRLRHPVQAVRARQGGRHRRRAGTERRAGP